MPTYAAAWRTQMVHTVEIDLQGERSPSKPEELPSRRTALLSFAPAITSCWSRRARPTSRSPAQVFPLTVDYREYTYAAGRFPGGFIKREGRPSGKRDPDRPPDRPAHPAAFSRRLSQRNPDHRHGAVGRSRLRSVSARHHRRCGVACDLGYSLPARSRRRPRRHRRRQHGRQPELR